jgi:hypothetical protein
MLRRLLFAGASVALAYVACWALRINRVAWTLLKAKYTPFEVIVWSVLLVLAICFSGLLGRSVKFLAYALCGVLGGYVAGLIAFFCLPMMPNQPPQAVFTVNDLGSSFFVSPLVTLTWLQGVISFSFLWAFRSRNLKVAGPFLLLFLCHSMFSLSNQLRTSICS